jgi:exopolyphosphatase/guanosine-5'-triphosphate,3'-diphosphate pyrophosphatase
LAQPLHFAAIDAGSNAIRLVIARAVSPQQIEEVEFERYPVRLGRRVFTQGRLDADTMRRGVQAFRHFRELLDQHRVMKYRAVATSATREARNRRAFIEQVRRETRIQLEVIDNEEEARLVREAVFHSLGEELAPRLIVDLGGGSLEVNLLRQGRVEASVGLPLGTVRLMETFGVDGAISEDEARRLRLHILNVLESCLPRRVDLTGAVAVACGGNAEALAELAPGPQLRGMDTLNVRLLRERLWQILGLDVSRRMKVFRVREDRADVMGIAAIVFSTLARWCNVQRMIVPGVGVREGVLHGLIREHFAAGRPGPELEEQRALMAGVERFVKRLHCESPHMELVRRLALSLFDQLRGLHGMGPDERLVLEVAATLHDVGRILNEEGHHKHGEYMVRNADIPELRGWRRDMAACLVRYHNRRSEPDIEHKVYASLEPRQRENVRALAALLRIAEGLDRDQKQSVVRVDVELSRREAFFKVHMRSASNAPIWGAQRRASLFEAEFGLKTAFSRTHAGKLVEMHARSA